MSGFNKFLLALALSAGGYSLWGTYHQKLFPLQPIYQKPYIIVYGREECGYCQAMRADLDSSHFLLPIVDVNAEVMVHPEPPDVAAKYRL